MVYSGREPGEKASPDEVHIKLLGYKWNSGNGILYPGFAELNLNKKIRGAKKSNVLPIVTLEDAANLLSSVTLTRRMVVSILAELYDPCRFWEPWKLQLKLMSQTLACMDWDEHQRTRNRGNNNYVHWLIFQNYQFQEYVSLQIKILPLASDSSVLQMLRSMQVGLLFMLEES